MASDEVKTICWLVTQRIVAERAPHLEANLRDLFDTVYDVAPTAEPPDSSPVRTDFGQEALDPETLREMTLMTMIAIPTYRIVVDVLGSAARDTIDYSINRLDLRHRLDAKREELIRRWPHCAAWIDIATHFVEAVFDELQEAKRRGDGCE